jgi:hexosaminidase
MFLLGLATLSQLPPKPAIIPVPSHVESKQGTFELNRDTVIVSEPGTARLARMLQGYVRPGTGFPLNLAGRSGRNAITLRLDPRQSDLGIEGYHLEVSPNGILISAPQDAGIFYGIQTLRQILPAQTFRASAQNASSIRLQSVVIDDQPRFGWRGALVDTSRHFMPKEALLRFIDGLALHKLNSFQLHLTDDQGWRMEVKKYPRLTEIGAWHRANKLTNDPTTWATVPDGGFYTQDDLREIVAYAKDRFVNVVPEIEMPGHSMAVVVAYPEFGNTGKQFELKGVNDGSEDVVNASPETVRFFQDVLTEVMDIFPSKFIHVGGDEVPKQPWKDNPKMQAQMKELGLKNEDELQSWFIHQMDSFLTQHGRRLIGWDEILEGGLAPGATVMSWRGIEGGIAAAKAGHDVVMAPTSHTYLDYYQSSDRSTEPQAIGGLVTLKKTYSFEPLPIELNADEQKHVLGAQGQLWTEYIPNAQHLEYMAYPRLCALAEVTWSPKAARNYDDFLTRLAIHLQRLNALGINYRPLGQPGPPPVGTWEAGSLPETFTTKSWDVSPVVREAGPYIARFQYLEGACRLDIEWAELLCDGTVVARDEHAGSTGSVDSENTYRLPLKEFKTGAKYSLRASIGPDGGTDSAGEIRFRKE